MKKYVENRKHYKLGYSVDEMLEKLVNVLKQFQIGLKE